MVCLKYAMLSPARLLLVLDLCTGGDLAFHLRKVLVNCNQRAARLASPAPSLCSGAGWPATPTPRLFKKALPRSHTTRAGLHLRTFAPSHLRPFAL